jgi:hypothetical protein
MMTIELKTVRREAGSRSFFSPSRPKFQVPSTKLQRSTKLQTPIWRIEIWCFSGAWMLALGAFLTCHA